MIPQTPDIMKSPLCYEGDKRNIPADTPLGTNQLSYKQGFPPITSIDVDAGGIAPERQDMNAALNLLSTFIYYMQSGNQFVWNNQLDYNTGAFVIGSDNAVYFCTQANGATSPNTVHDPVSSTGYWVKVIDAQGVFNINIIADGAVSTAKLANNAVTNAKIANAAITGAKLANNTITSTQIAANAVTASELADNAVDTNAIANLAVTNAKIANSAVNDAKISGVSALKVSGLATVAKTGSYNDLTNKPTIPTNAAPLPIDSLGSNDLGTWKSIFFSSLSNAALPSGGTWAYLAIGLDSNGTIPVGTFTNNIFAGVKAGGTKLNFTSAVQFASGLFWRIQ